MFCLYNNIHLLDQGFGHTDQLKEKMLTFMVHRDVFTNYSSNSLGKNKEKKRKIR